MGKEGMNPIQAEALATATIKILRETENNAIAGERIRVVAIGLRLLKPKKEGKDNGRI